MLGLDGDDERGFTIIELFVVLLIIAIVLAIAIPTYLGARQHARDREDPPSGLVFSKRYEPAHEECHLTWVGKMAVETCDEEPEKFVVELQRCERARGPVSSRGCTYRTVEVDEETFERAVSGRSYMEAGRL